MKRIHVNIINHLDRVPDLEEILPKEFAVATKWKEQGILEHLFIKDDRTGAVLLFKDVDEAKAKELVSTLPLSKYFESIEYAVVEKPF